MAQIAYVCIIFLLISHALPNVQAAKPAAEQRDSQVDKKVEKLTQELAELKAKLSEQETATMQRVDSLAGQLSEMQRLLNTKTTDDDEPSITDKKGVKQPIQQTTTGGVSYVRWGRTTCSSSAETDVLYKGYIGSSHWGNIGGGSNFLCLHEEPEWGVYYTGNQGSSFIYGTEYSLTAELGSPFSTENNQNMSLAGNDAPCAVCHNALRSNQVMIPARHSCPANWTIEYRGYLVSSYHNNPSHQRSSYICLDKAPEVIPSGQGYVNGTRLYSVQAACGSLPCPDYVGGYEIACVVCTK